MIRYAHISYTLISLEDSLRKQLLKFLIKSVEYDACNVNELYSATVSMLNFLFIHLRI